MKPFWSRALVRQFVAFDVRDGLIRGIFAVLNPDKLRRLDHAIGS